VWQGPQEDYGGFYLARRFDPERFDADAGFPSFGVAGVPFADFEKVVFMYIIGRDSVFGRAVRIPVYGLRLRGDVARFVVLPDSPGVSVIPVGEGARALSEHVAIRLGVAIPVASTCQVAV
jgi:hypothetical protein